MSFLCSGIQNSGVAGIPTLDCGSPAGGDKSIILVTATPPQTIPAR